MTARSSAYTRTAIVLHWCVALLIFGAFPLGLYMSGLPLSPTRLKLYSYHKWIGVTVFLLIVFRLIWRRIHAAPPLSEAMPAWQRKTAASLHHLLYLLAFVIPVSGWLMSSALGFQTVYLGLVPIPDLLHKDKALGEALKLVHQSLNWLLLGLVVLHVAAAIKHHFVDRDDVLARMIPFLKPRQENQA